MDDRNDKSVATMLKRINAMGDSRLNYLAHKLSAHGVDSVDSLIDEVDTAWGLCLECRGAGRVMRFSDSYSQKRVEVECKECGGLGCYD